MSGPAKGLALGAAGGVVATSEQWSDPRGGRPHGDVFLVAEDRDALARHVDAFLAQRPLPAIYRIAYGRTDDGKWRTYVLSTKERLAVARAVTIEVGGAGEVYVELGPDDAQRFGDLTARHTGAKLAILVDGHVQAAPVLQMPIRGGRVVLSADDAELLARHLRERG
jgi:preprotein translocase subunit SecD